MTQDRNERARAYLLEHLSIGHRVSQQVGERIGKTATQHADLIADLLAKPDHRHKLRWGGIASETGSWELLRTRCDAYLQASRGIFLFEDFLRRSTDRFTLANLPSIIADEDDIYYYAAAFDNVDSAYYKSRSFHVTIFWLHGVDLEQIFLPSGSLNSSLASRLVTEVFVSAHDQEAFLSTKISA